MTRPPTMAGNPYPDLFAFSARLGGGINFGDALEACHEGEGGVLLTEEYFDLVRQAGFNSIRLPVRFSAHADENPPYAISPSFFSRVDWAVQNALERNLLIIIDLHHYLEMMEDPLRHKERFLALWEQIARHYQNYPPEVVFEPLNEPNTAFTPSIWNKIVVETLDVIRRTNPQRAVIIGPVSWNAYDWLTTLELPSDDRGIIVTFHYYLPFEFTHQGAEWVDGSEAWLGAAWPGSDAEKREMSGHFDQVASWAQEYDRPIYLGEFGAYSKADMDSRARWTTFVARQAEAHNFSWSYWEFCSGFGVYDPKTRQWRAPLLNALLPPAP